MMLANLDNRDIPLTKRLHLTTFLAQKNVFIKAVLNFSRRILKLC